MGAAVAAVAEVAEVFMVAEALAAVEPFMVAQATVEGWVAEATEVVGAPDRRLSLLLLPEVARGS